MIVQQFGSDATKEIEGPPADDGGCRYCYAASKTCTFYEEGDAHFIHVEGELRIVMCTEKSRGFLGLKCSPITEEEARKLIAEHATYN